MNNKEFDRYFEELSNLNLENFSQHIKAYSKFLSYVNPDYKYNGTYLDQYIDEFEKICISLPSKKKKYEKVVDGIILVGKQCDVIDIMVDNVFHGYHSKLDDILKKQQYVAFDKEKITSNSIEVRAMFVKGNEEYIFHKKYDDIENKLLVRICKDVNIFLELKELRG